MKAIKQARKDRQLDNSSTEECLRLTRNSLASQHFDVNNYNSLLKAQKESVDNLIKGKKNDDTKL
jgi:hypothetical protein